MKQKSLYYVLVICLVIISILLTILVMSHNNSDNKSDNKSDNNRDKLQDNYNKQYKNYSHRDVDYAYDYDGYWFQPSRWWNNLWRGGHRYNPYMRSNYDRQDGLNIHNRYNFIHQQPALQPALHPVMQPPQDTILKQNQNTPNAPIIPENSNDHYYNKPKIELIRPEFGSDFPFPTLSSSTHIMPEEIAMSPLGGHGPAAIENSIHTISRFTADLAAKPDNYNYNFNYKGPDLKNQKPSPVDMMASQSIYLEPNEPANQIIIPPVVMEHLNTV